MTELNWTLSWTLVTIGVCWLFVSCAVALALGRIIQRSKAGASISPESMDGHSEAYIADEDSDLDDEGSRAASGTRLRAVWFEDEALETKPDERKVS